jgi:hypothetical protein
MAIQFTPLGPAPKTLLERIGRNIIALTSRIVFSAVLLTSASAFAQMSGGNPPPTVFQYQPRDPPFYSQVGEVDNNLHVIKKFCISGDGTIPAWVANTADEPFATLVRSAVAYAQQDPDNPNQNPCDAGSLLNQSGTGFQISANAAKVSANDTQTTAGIDPIYGGYDEGGASAMYMQQFHAPPGTSINLAYTINGNGFVWIVAVSTTGPVGSDGCTPTVVGGGPIAFGLTNASSTNGPALTPSAKNYILKLPAFTVTASGAYTVEIFVLTELSPFYANIAPRVISVTPGCGLDTNLDIYWLGNGRVRVYGFASALPPFTDVQGQAVACGYSAVNWRQWITSWPCPSTLHTNPPWLPPSPSNQCPDFLQGISAPPAFLEPPKGGYTYLGYAPPRGASAEAV